MILPSTIRVDVLAKERDGIGTVSLVEDFTAETSTGTVTVKAGYQSDFASIPRPVRPFLCTMGKNARAALLHDWLLHLNDRRANRVFLEALKASNVSFVGRYLMFAFVWVFTLPDFMFGSQA
jgi:hypothetical protein